MDHRRLQNIPNTRYRRYCRSHTNLPPPLQTSWPCPPQILNHPSKPGHYLTTRKWIHKCKPFPQTCTNKSLLLPEKKAQNVTPLSSISVFLHGCRGHTCCPHAMLLFLVPVPGTFLLLSSFNTPLAIVPYNKVIPHWMPHRGPSSFLLIVTSIPIPQSVYKLQ